MHQVREDLLEKIENFSGFNQMDEIEQLKEQLQENRSVDLMQTKYEIGNRCNSIKLLCQEDILYSGSYVFTLTLSLILISISKLSAFKKKVIQETIEKLDEENN